MKCHVLIRFEASGRRSVSMSSETRSNVFPLVPLFDPPTKSFMIDTLAGEIIVKVYFDAEAAYFSVSDTGVGIPAKDLPKLGERFYRVDVSSIISGLSKQHLLIIVH
jgi:hypothetical protein